jgi:hypothetical protein
MSLKQDHNNQGKVQTRQDLDRDLSLCKKKKKEKGKRDNPLLQNRPFLHIIFIMSKRSPSPNLFLK